MKLEDFKYGKPIVLLSSIAGVAIALFSCYDYFKNKLEEYKKETETRTEKKIIEVVLNNDHYLIDKIIHELDDRYDDGPRIDSLINSINDKDKFFAVGFRGDGTGNLYYKDYHGNVYKCHYNYEEKHWFYIDETGKKQYAY